MSNTLTPDQIKQWRTAHQLTQQEAANYVEVTLRAWQFWEAGTRHPPAMLDKVLASFDAASCDDTHTHS